MTKEEYIEKLINLRKQGYEEPRNAICNEVSCSDCYFACEPCNGHEVINVLLDHIIDKEAEHQETNLEHYWDTILVNFSNRQVDGYLAFIDRNVELKEWLLAPYEEPKPKYKLSKFEYDLLDSYDCLDDMAIKFNDYCSLRAMKERGYFKGIPDDVDIFDIVKSAEVIDSE